MSVYIVGAKRTPIGSFLGSLSKIKGTQLMSIAIQSSLQLHKIPIDKVDEVILGNVCQANQGQNPARQAALGAGISQSIPCWQINKVCASGMKSIILGAQQIQLNQANIVVTGGFESMSQIPFYIDNYRQGVTFGDKTLIDGLAKDGLTDVYNNIPMGTCAEKTAHELKITREINDAYAIQSYERTLKAQADGIFNSEITPVKINDKLQVTEDEEPKKFRPEKIPTIKPVFAKNGTITAANSSKINDGACSIVLASEEAVRQHYLKPLARIVSFADAEVDPIDFCIAPQFSSMKALKNAGLTIKDINYFEFNEAFSTTVLANLNLMELDAKYVNVHGGAVALGHPIGMSGARIVQSLQTVLQKKRGKYGLAGICNGGGGATSIIIENLV